MDFSYLLNNNSINDLKLKNYGFSLKNGKYFLKKALNEDFIAKINIDKNLFTINLLDTNFNEDYEMLNIENINTGFVTSIRNQVKNLAEQIAKKCFDCLNNKNYVVNLIKDKYDVSPQSPWIEYPNYLTFKHPKTQKWFALIMDVNMNKLIKDKNYVVDVINLKAPPEYITKIIDNKTIFPAYHMNKIHWCTVLINNISQEKLSKLIDISYNSVF